MPQIPPLSPLAPRIFTRFYSARQVKRKQRWREWTKAQTAGTAKDYPNALQALDALKSNRTATALFTPLSQDSNTDRGSNTDPNAVAIPEMLLWLSRAGYQPQDLTRMKHIHIAGTKGKGSVASYATALLLEAGHHLPIKSSNVGTYKSPHLISPLERISINGAPISEKIFAKFFWEIWDRFTLSAEAEGVDPALAKGPSSKPFFFRFMTILAWHVFVKMGVKNVVMECGIGGEYDATNVLPKEAVSTSVVTSLGLDHTDMLGATVESIAWHKAGIFKEGTTAVSIRDERQGVQNVLRQRAQEKGANLLEIKKETLSNWGGAASKDDEIARSNQALAVMAVRSHCGERFDDATAEKSLLNTPDWMIQTLKNTKLTGVREVVDRGQEKKIRWLLDGAHTRESLHGVAAWLNDINADHDKVILIFNQYDRDVRRGLEEFLASVEQTHPAQRKDLISHLIVFAKESETDVDWDLASVRERFNIPEAHVVNDVKGAVKEAGAAADERSKVLVTGSFHLVGDVMKEFGKDPEAGGRKERL